MPNKTKNPGALAGATGVDREKHYSPEHAKIGPHGQGRYTGFKSLKWERNVLDVIAAARTLKLTDSPTFLAAAVAMDMACFAGQDGRLFRAADDGADAVGASVSNVRDARDWLCRAGLAEKIKVTNDQITGADRKRTRKKKGRDAQDFQLLFVDVQEAIFRLNAGGNTSTYSTPMEAEYSMPISTPKKAPYSAPMGVTTGEEPKRARARANARPAPITTDRAYSSIIEGDQLKGTDKYTERGLPALEAPAPASHERASAPVCDPDAWRSDPELSCVPTAMEHIPLARRREPCASERPHVVTDFSDFMPDDEDFDTLPPSHVGRAPEGAPGPNLHIDGDVDLFLNDDNHEFLRHLKRAECELATLHGAAEIEIQRHLNDALDGLSGGDSTAADRFRRDLWHLLREVHHSRRDTVFREHLDIVRSFLAQAIGGMRYADDAIKVFIQDIWGGVSNG